MWKHPWGLAEGGVICVGLLVTGSLLQWVAGPVDPALFRYPVNLITGGVYIGILLLLHLMSSKKKALQWFGGLKAAVTAVAGLLVVVILMGLTRQAPASADLSGQGLIAAIGFMQMTISWPFLLLFVYFVSVLGLVTIRRIRTFRIKKDVPFLLNHAGLFLALFAAIMGSGDLQKLRMTTQVNTPEWRAMDEAGQLVELPLAIELKSFTIEEYPPKIVMIDNESGKSLPEGQPVNILVESSPLTAHILDWEINVTRFLPSAACYLSQDTVNFVEFHTEGATTAVHIRAVNRQTGMERTGWVSCGSFMFPYIALTLNEEVSLVMPEPEPRRFASEVTLYARQGDTKEAVIEVNKPIEMAGWKIYQLSYDESKGKWSRMSVFELVRDPWIPFVYTGIGLMIVGAVCLFVQAPGKTED
ncbi:MAG: cytochrome c biogenesis protein ResB [Tannerellaceae bacterium]|nr:cytochrome c biogenesis protein ResB [Tannerellaceae bacterium]